VIVRKPSVFPGFSVPASSEIPVSARQNLSQQPEEVEENTK
jgi:hypothetical protein